MRRALLLFAGVALAYAAASRLAFSWFGADGISASFFPAAGVSLAALVLTERRRWPIVLAAVALAELSLDLYHGIDLAPSLGYVAANVTEPLVGALLLTSLVTRVDLSRTQHLGVFIACAVLAGPALGAVVGATTNVLLVDGEGWLRFVGQWWVGDGLGVLVVAGSVLALRAEPVRALGALRLVEGVVLAALALGSTMLVFWLDWLPLVYLPIALLVVIAFRIGTAGVALTGAAIAFLAAESTSDGHTFWDTVNIDPSTGVVYLQVALGILVASSLALAAEIAQRERAAKAWASADAARQESTTVAAHAERLRSLAETVGSATTSEAVAAALEQHGFAGVVGLPPPGSTANGLERYLRESSGRIARDAYARVALLEGEREARKRAEELERRASLLQQVTAALAASRTTQEVAAAVVCELIPAVGGKGGSIFVFDPETESLRMLEDDGVPVEMLDRYRVVPLDADIPLAEAFRTGQPLLFRDLDELRSRYPRLVDELDMSPSEHGAAFADLPLVAGFRKVGHLAIAFPERREFDERERAYLFAATEAAGQALARVLLDEAEREARWRAELLELHAKHLAAAATVQEVVDTTVGVLKGIHTVTLCLLEGDSVVIAASNGLTEETRAEYARFPLSTKTLVAETIRSGTALEVRTGAEYDERFPDGARARRRHGSESLRCVPLVSAGGQAQGALTMSSRTPHWFTESLRQLLEGIAEQTSLALDRARLHERAEEAARNSALLVRLGDVLERATTAQARAQGLVDVLEAELSVSSAVQILDEEDAGPRLLAESLSWRTSERAASEAVPLRARGRTLGVLEIRGDSEFARTDLGREIVARVAVALDNALLYERERKVSHTLQLGLLGGALGQADGVELAAAYRAGTAALDVGGDWYDAFELPDGSLALVVGDVVGHGLDAAIVMGQLRGAVRALAPACEPARVLEHLDTFVETMPDAGMATIAYVRLDPKSGEMRYACAGHPPPLVVTADGRARFLWDGRSAAIGSMLGLTREDASGALGAGDALVLYTDGVVERRSESLDVGLERLARVAREPHPPARLVEHIPDVLLEGQTQDDDVCVLVARRTGTLTHFVHRLPASPAELAPLRARLREWLEVAGFDRAVTDETLLGVSEAAANSIEHGLRFDPSGSVTVEASVDGERRLHVTVRDDGRWRDEHDDPDRGFGLQLMEATMDSVSIDRGFTGTVVRMERATKDAARV